MALVALATLDLRLQEGMSVLEALVDGLRPLRALIILDNCEHVLDAAAELAGAIRDGCPAVTVLATSREPLGVEGERVWPVRSLDPALEGVDLFLDRATAADAGFNRDRQLEAIAFARASMVSHSRSSWPPAAYAR